MDFKEKMCVLVLNLPQTIVDQIDDTGKTISLKRGPTARIYLVKALEKYKDRTPDLFLGLKKPGEESIPLSMQITSVTNKQLENLRSNLPFSKKLLAELLIIRAVRDQII